MGLKMNDRRDSSKLTELTDGEIFETIVKGENDSLLQEEGHAPFDGFGSAGAGPVHEFAEMLQDRLREGRSFFNVGVYAWVACSFGHGASW
jgi:predicted amidohydrolase